MGGLCSTHGKMSRVYKILVGKSEGKRPLRKPSRKWEDNIRLDRREIGLEDVDWIHVTQDRDHWWALVDMAMNFQLQ